MADHPPCRHFIAVCCCARCWPYRAQCIHSTICQEQCERQISTGSFYFPEEWDTEFQDDYFPLADIIIPPPPEFSNGPTMDRSNKNEDRLALLHQPTGDSDISTSETIRPIRNISNTTDIRTDTTILQLHQGSSHSNSRSGTPHVTPPNSPSSEHSEQNRVDIFPNQHQQSTDTTTNFLLSNETIPPTTSIPIHSGTKRIRTPDEIQNFIHDDIDGCTPTKQTPQMTSSRRNSTSSRPSIRGIHRDLPPSQTPSTSNTIGEDDTQGGNSNYTFILHKTTFTNIPAPTKKSPTFALFDHGDHVHIVFAVRHPNNATRQMGDCAQYVEDKKSSAKHTVNQRTFTIDYISNLITDNNISSFESFQRILPTDIKIQLLNQLGYVGQNLIKSLIKIHSIASLQLIKTKHFLTLLSENINIHHIHHPNVSWLSMLFRKNNINIPDFFSKFLAIHSMNIVKINSFILQIYLLVLISVSLSKPQGHGAAEMIR
jgi:hypothetical protein